MTKANRGHQLIDELSHYDNQTGVNDILCGRYLDAIQALPQHIRMMFQDSDMHVILDENNRVVKIIKKRDPEFLTGTEKTFWLDEYGRKIPLTEDEMDAQLGLEHDPEDVYAHPDVEMCGLGEIGVLDEEFVEDDDADFDLATELVEDESHHTVVSEYVAPLDKWDIIFDATDYLRHCKSLIEVSRFIVQVKSTLSQNYWKSDLDTKLEILNNLFDGGFVITKGMFKEALNFSKMSASERNDYLDKLADDLIYSSDLFIPIADKRIRNVLAADLEKNAGMLSKQELARALSQKVDMRVKNSVELTAKAVKMPKGREKGKTLLRAQAMKISRINAIRALRSFTFVPTDPESETDKRWTMVGCKTTKTTQSISQAESRAIWDAWRNAQVAKDGYVKLPHWLFKKAYSRKLLTLVSKNIIKYDDATVELSDKMEKLYGLKGVSELSDCY